MLIRDDEIALDDTLSKAEMAELENFMDSPPKPRDCMDLSSMDGFLTALVVGPEEVPQSEWFPVIWGTRGEGDPPIFRSKKQEKRIWKLVTRFYHDVVRTFAVEGGEFVPLITYWLGEGKPRASGEEWCTGFYVGFSLRDKAWRPLCEDEEHAELLDPFFFFLDEEDRLEIAAGRDPESMREEMLGLIVPSVFAIDKYWKNYLREEQKRSYWNTLRAIREQRLASWRDQLRGAAGDLKVQHNRRPPGPGTGSLRVGRVPRVGQDDPCPCGSGKTLRECCRFIN